MKSHRGLKEKKRMYEEHLLMAVARLRAINKIPNLNISLPGTKQGNGETVYTCDNCKNAKDTDSPWITFHVAVPQSDLELTPQQIDQEANIESISLDNPDTIRNRITYRFAFRIWTAYKNAVEEMQKTLNP